MSVGVAFFVAICCAAIPAVAQSLAPGTTWVNDHGSTLTITGVGPDGRLTGTYSNSQQDYPCRNIAFPLTGWIDGRFIAYSMRAKTATVDCGTITSWTGILDDGKLYAEWSLASIDPRTKKPMLDRGRDVYRVK
jgi:hypothetical protein